MIIQRVLLIILLFPTVKMFSQAISEAKQKALTQTLYQHSDQDSPGIAVGIIKDGQIIYEHYLGYANLEHKVKIDKNTRFNIASNAKQFTALCALQLAEEGKLNLEDDIRKYLPYLYEDIEDKITISNLIAHTSGVRDIYGLWALKGQTWWKLFLDNSDAIDLLKPQTTLNFKPGTDYLYSNSNYILLAEIIKTVSGEDFSDFTKMMFEKLEMPNTHFLDNYMTVIPNKARPYGNWNGWLEYPYITEIHGDGALFTSLPDQLKWEQIIQNNTGQYLSKKVINDSQAPIISNYGYGLMFDNYKGLNLTYHDGSTGAYHATFLRFPAKRLSIVIATNNGSVPTNYLAKQLTDIMLDLEDYKMTYPATPEDIQNLDNIQDILGNYKNEEGRIIRIVKKEGSIFREIYERKPVKLLREQGGLLHFETDQDLKINFTNIGKSDQQFTIYQPSRAPITYYNLDNSALDNFNKEELNGSFYNQETDTEIEIKFFNQNTYYITTNDREGKAELWVKDLLRINSYEIQIVRDRQENVVALSVNNDRIRNVIFKRK